MMTSPLTSDSKHEFFDEELEKKSILDATFGSIEAIAGVSFSNGKLSILELQEEIEELKNQIKNLNDEKVKLANQLNSTEDNNVNLATQNQDLHNRLKSMKLSLDKAFKVQAEMEEKKLQEFKEEDSKRMKQIVSKNNSRMTELLNENADLQSKLDDTMEQLNVAMKDLNLAKRSHNNTMEKLKVENEEMKVKLNESMVIKVQLENRIEELRSDLTSVRESQFFQRTPSIFDTGEADSMLHSFEDDPFATKLVVNRAEEDAGPTANSTPFVKRISRNIGVRGSISDEIKFLGVREMDPFCEKSALHNGSGVAPKTQLVETATQTALFRYEEIWDHFDFTTKILAAIGILLMTVMFLFFTFFGAIELEDGRKLLPIFWFSPLPEPIALLTIRNYAPTVW